MNAEVLSSKKHEYTAVTTTRQLPTDWIAQHRIVELLQSDKQASFTADLIQDFGRLSHLLQQFATPNQLQTPVLTDGQN